MPLERALSHTGLHVPELHTMVNKARDDPPSVMANWNVQHVVHVACKVHRVRTYLADHGRRNFVKGISAVSINGLCVPIQEGVVESEVIVDAHESKEPSATTRVSSDEMRIDITPASALSESGL